MRRVIGAVALATVALAACTEEPPPGFEGLPDPTESPTLEDSPQPAEIDVTTVPAEITPEYVDAVVNTIYSSYGELVSEALAMPLTDQPVLPAGFEERLDELFAAQYRERREAEVLQFLGDEAVRSEAVPADEYGGLRFETQLVQIVEDSCIVAVGRLSRELTIPGGGPLPNLSAISLGPSANRSSSNPTPWTIWDQLRNSGPDGTPNDDEVMLNSTLAEYGSALDNACEGE